MQTSKINLRFLFFIIFHALSFAKDDSAHLVKKTLKIYYFDREPLYIKTSDPKNPQGIVVERVKSLLSGMSLEFVEMPPKRQLEVLLANPDSCGLGWFSTAEREGIYNISLPIFYDGDLFLASHSQQILDQVVNLSSIIQSQYKILIADQFSYGSVLDYLIKDAKNIERINGKQKNILKMVAMKRADFFFISEEEKNYIESNNLLDDKEIKNLKFKRISSLSRNSARHLLCSKKIDQKLFSTINKKISSYYLYEKF